MLVECKECGLPVSDKAPYCPHCGIAVAAKISTSKTIRKNKRKRLPNGFGQITKLKKNLRKPYRALVTVGKSEDGKPITKLLKPEAYFETYNDAYMALLEYNRNPYDVSKDITMEELHDRWLEKYKKNGYTQATLNNLKTAWSYCHAIKDIKVSEFRIRHMKFVIENGTRVYGGKERPIPNNTKFRVKEILSMMLDYAVEYEITDKNVARSFVMPKDVVKNAKTNKKNHISFTKEEMDILWKNEDQEYVDVLLYQCYSGWRPQELGDIKVEDVNLEVGIIKGGRKTDAGTNRIVPIHGKVRHIVEKWYKKATENNMEYLFYAVDGRDHKLRKMEYRHYNYRFHQIISNLGLNPDHLPHDPRKQFTTLAKKYNVDEYAIKYIVGHVITDLTEKVYTDRETSWLISEMEKIK